MPTATKEKTGLGNYFVANFPPFSFWISFAIAAIAFFIVSGIGYRYFLNHATPQEIREDLEARKNSPG